MIQLLLLTSFASLSSTQPRNVLYPVISQLKSSVCLPGSPLVLYYHANLDQSDAVLLDHVLANQSESKIITTRLDQFILLATDGSCGLFFFGSLITEVLFVARQYPTRKLVIISNMSFHVIEEALRLQPLANTLFLVHGEQQYAVYHYNQFQKELYALSETSSDTIPGAVQQFRLSVFNEVPQEVPFIELLLSRTNSTLVTYKSDFHFVFMYELGNVHLYHVYMHRMESLRILVPRLSVPKPMIYVLIDPYDAATWMIYAAMIFLAAMVRTIFSHKLTPSQVLTNIRLIVSFVLIDCSITFYRELDRALLGLFKVMNIVLMTAYESLVISFLLSPRFFPELDTVEQINDSCYWDHSLIVDPFHFRHVQKLQLDHGDIYTSIEVARNRSYCFIFSPRFDMLLEKEMHGQPLVTSGYRWSKATLQTSPVMAAAYGDPVVREMIVYYAAVFYAEGGLFQYFMGDMGRDVVDFAIQEKPVGLGDLSLVWLVYLTGVGSSLLVFMIEGVCEIVRKKKAEM